jgi:serine-type D-Ala-D-Ala carboxypeptidase
MSTFAEVEAIIQRGLEDTAPAIALSVWYSGERLVERAYGYLDPETRRQPVNNSTLFDLASVTKLFTTTLFLRQVAAGKVAIDDPVINVIPEFGRYGARPIEGGQNPHTMEREAPISSGIVDPAVITFRHLLTHTSGLAPWRDLFIQLGPMPDPPQGYESSVNHQERLVKALDLIASFPFVSHPGERVNYSDLGLILLGTAVARLEGETETLDSALHNMLGLLAVEVQYNPMKPAQCVPTEYDERWRKRRCQGEVHDENACALGGIAGHAGLFGCASDVADLGVEWLMALDGKRKYFPAELAREAIRHQGEYRGLGWVIRQPEGSSSGRFFSPRSFGHTGFTGTSLWVDPERELVVSLMTNRVYFGRNHDGILRFRPAIHDAIAQWVNAL